MANDNYTPDGTMESLMRSLQQIGIDFWGKPATAQETQEARRSVERDFASLAAQENGTAGVYAASPVKTPDPSGKMAGEAAADNADALPVPEKKLTFAEFWQIADDAIDWTEVMTHSRPVDGVKDEERWKFCHLISSRVLAGDVDAYCEVLNHEKPLDDVLPYTVSVDALVADADEVEVRFGVREDMLSLNGNEYPAALSLRIARDMMALLPINQVHVYAMRGDETLMDVCWRREKLNRLRMSYVKPLELALDNGAAFADAAEEQPEQPEQE